MTTQRRLAGILLSLLTAVTAPGSPAAAQGDDLRATARDGYLFGYPLVLMDITRRIVNSSTGGAFVHMLSAPAPPFRLVVAPNGDTRYSSVWADLSAEPQVLHVPDAGTRYFVVQAMDAWTDVIADPTARVPGTAPADYAFVGPGWRGALPPGVHAVRSSTNDVWILARTRARPDDTADDITAIQRGYALVPLSRYRDPSYAAPAALFREPNAPTGPTPPSLVAELPATAFFARLSAALVRDPPREADRPIVDRLRRAGLIGGPGTTQLASDATPVGAGVADARALLDRYDPPNVPHGNGWRWTRNTGRFGTDYAYRAFIARTLLAANLPEDALYADATTDANGAPLDGARRYTLHFAPDAMPPANAFWSLTMYSPDGYLVDNPAHRYTLRDAALRRNADGSIDVTIAHDAPADAANWLPSPTGPFLVTLRLYWPRQDALEGRYAAPPIRPL
jgi:hypothetical protein